MMKQFFMAALALLLWVAPVFAVDPIIPALPHTTTFPCSDFVYDHGNPAEYQCDQVQFSQNVGTDGLGHYTSINTANNYSGGGGGGGLRQWLGLVKNQSSPGMYWNFKFGGGSPSRDEPRLGIRFYIRYMSGLDFGPTGDAGTKILFIQNGMWFEGNNTQFRLTDGSTTFSSTSFGLSNLWGGSTGDGQWHCMEVFVQAESSLGAGDAIAKAWVDGVQRVDGSGFNLGVTGFPSYTMPSNNHEIFNAGGAYIDIDDVKTTNDGVQIGCLSGGGGGGGGQDSNPTIRHFEIKFINHVFGAPLLFERGSF